MNRTTALLLGMVMFGMSSGFCAETDAVFHGYYYCDGSKPEEFAKLTLPNAEEATLKSLLAAGLSELSEETYWRSFGRFMITPFPQVYIAWGNKSYWIVLADKVGDDHRYVKGKQGIHLFEFTNGKVRYAYHDMDEKKHPNEFSSLVMTGHDWSISDESKKKEKLLSKDEVKIMKDNILWTDAVHERMQKKFPPDKEWKE